jgi:hypothetical protein
MVVIGLRRAKGRTGLMMTFPTLAASVEMCGLSLVAGLTRRLAHGQRAAAG